MSRAILVAACCAASALASCVQFGYQRQIVERRPDPALLAQFAIGHASLGEILDVLGAPIDVYEGANGAPAITYGGLDSGEWAFSVSAPVSDYTSASLSYTDTTARTPGFMLIFDTDERLAIVREGLLGDLRQPFVRRRPASVDDLEKDAGKAAP